MRSRNIRTLVALTVCFFSFCMPGRLVLAQEPPTLEQIIEGLEQVEKMLFESESFLIRYERIKALDLSTPSADSLKRLLAEWTIAHRGGNWFNERRYTHPFKTKELLVPAEPSTRVAKGRFFLEWKQDNKSAVIDYSDKYQNIYGGWLYTLYLSLDAGKHIAKSTGEDIAALRQKPSLADELSLPFLPEFLRKNKMHYKVSPAQEKVDDALCWVVEWPGMDRFWIDPQRGFAIPRRTYNWGPGKPLRIEIRQRGYREVKPGLWLPFELTHYGYASLTSDEKALWGKKTFQYEYIVHSIEFDELPNDFFDIKLPPGTRVNDCVRDIQYKITDNPDPFSAAIAEAKKSQRRSSLFWLLLGGVALTAAAILIYWIRQRWKLRRSA